MAKKATSLHTIINELVDRTNTDTQRIRALETREEAMLSRLDSVENELLNINQSLSKIVKDSEAALKTRDATISELKGTIKEIVKHLKGLANNDRVSELESLIEIYNPLKSNFITREEADNMIRERMSVLRKNK